MEEIKKLLDIMADLRDPREGCPWDLAQSFATIAPYTLEEAYEVADAIAREDFDDLKGELGDLLFQVVFHARLAEEAGEFSFADVVDGISDKLTRRHPHVFGSDAERARGAVEGSWEALKAEERAAWAGDDRRSALDDVPLALPALKRAVKLGNRASAKGFDWPTLLGARAKLDEELGEFDDAVASADRGAIEEELGDILFSVTNLARHLDVDAESALQQANRKFERRFRGVEAAAAGQAADMSELDIDALESLWQAQKSR